MSRRTEAVKLLDLVKTRVQVAGSVAVKYPNQPFTPPTDAPYVHVLIAPMDSVRESLGADNFRVRCWSLLQFDIYTSTDTGTKAMDDLEDLITNAFQDLECRTSDDERIYIMQPRSIAFSPKDGKIRKSVQFRFHRDEYRSSSSI